MRAVNHHIPLARVSVAEVICKRTHNFQTFLTQAKSKQSLKGKD
jgi:hypothetical protein